MLSLVQLIPKLETDHNVSLFSGEKNSGGERNV